MFKLTDEQIKEIIEFYGGSKETIFNIEECLNKLNIIDDEEDYLDIVAAVVAQHTTVQLKIKQADNKEQRIKQFRSLDEIIEAELKRKYQNDDHKQNQLIKIYSNK